MSEILKEFGLSFVSTGFCIDCGEEMFSASGKKQSERCSACDSLEHSRQGRINIKKRVEDHFDNYLLSDSSKFGLSIPLRYKNSDLCNFIGNVSTDVEKWILQRTENLLIQSPKAGNGKTHLSIACMLEYLKSKKAAAIEMNVAIFDKRKPSAVESNVKLTVPTGKFVNFSDLMLEVKASFESKDITEQDIIKKYCDYTILVVDDIGAEKSSDYTQAVIYSILNNRYENMKPTIITTNLSSGDITGSYGSRILSRIASGVVVTLDGADRRLSK